MGEIKIIGARIRALREFADWSQGQLAYKAGTTSAQISRLENNERPGAQAILLARLADALNTTTDYLVGRTNDPAPLDVNGAKYDPELRMVAATLLERWSQIKELDPSGESLRQLLTVVMTQAAAFEAAMRATNRGQRESKVVED